MSLDERTRRWRSELKRTALVEGGSRLAAVWLAALALTGAADKLWLLPQTARLTLWGLGAGLAAATFWRWLWRPLRAADTSAALAAAARRHPHLRDFLRPAWELKRAAPGHTSAALAEEHVRRTEALLAELPETPLEARPLPAFWWTAGVLSLAALAWCGAGLPRVLAPWRDVPLEEYLAITPGTSAVDWGRSAEIRARWRSRPGGREAGALKLWIAGRPAPWSTVTDEGAAFATAALSAPLRYRLTWRDLSSAEYTLTPAPAPQLESPRVKVEGRAEEPLSAAEPVKARRGAWVMVSGRPNQPLSEAALRVSFLPNVLPLKKREDGAWEAGFFAHESGSFRFDLRAEDGRSDPEPVSYQLEAKANEAPVVDLLSPTAPLQASPDDVIPVAWSARDDSGLARVSLLAGDKEIPMAKPGKADAIGEYQWDLSGLQPGQKIEFRVKAVDDDRAPLAGLSAPGTVEIVDFRAKHEAAADRLERAGEALAKLAAKHEALAKAPDAAQQAALPRDWNDVLKRLEELARATSQDPMANPGLREQTQAVQDELSRPRDLTQHEKLAKQLRKAERLLRDGKNLQTLSDFRDQSARMDQLGAEMRDAMQTKDGAKMGKALSKLQRQMDELRKAIESLPKAEASSQEAQSRQSYSMPLLKAQTTADALQMALKNGDTKLAEQLMEELSRELQQISDAVRQASQNAQQAAPKPSARMQQASRMWDQTIEEQRRLLEGSQRVEERRRGQVLEKQKKLLQELAREQALIVSSAAARGVQPGVLEPMRQAQGEFEAGKVLHAPNHLRSAIPRLPQGLAERELDVLKKLENAPRGSEADPSDQEAKNLGKRQGELRGRTGALRQELQELEEESAVLPPDALDSLGKAQEDQKAAEEALGRGDSAAAAGHQQRALEKLELSGEKMGQSAGRQLSIEQGMRPEVRPSRPGGQRGVNTGAVPLPGAQDYRPPRELREELERSQRESRPEALDPVIKEYFRRLAE